NKMPEVVYPTQDAEGNPRNWDDVFPVWKSDDDVDWRVVNGILEAIAMNNRFGDKTPEQLKESMIEYALSQTDVFLEKDGFKTEERTLTFSSLGRHLYYIRKVFENLGGAYR